MLSLNRAAPHLLALFVYTLLAVVVTFPLVLNLGERVVANEPGETDAFLGVWNVWWTAQAIGEWRDPFFTSLLFHPQGLDLFWQTLSLPQGLLALPITLLFGPLPAYNLLMLASYVLGGYFMFLFVCYVLSAGECRIQDSGFRKEGSSPRRWRFFEGNRVLRTSEAPLPPWARGWGEGRTAVLSKNPMPERCSPQRAAIFWAALVAGAIFVLAPFHTQKVLDGQLEVASMQWLPLCFLMLTLFFARPSWWRGLLSGLLLLWVGLGTWYYGLFALITAGVAIGLWVFWGEPRTQNPELRAQNSEPRTQNLEPRRAIFRRMAWGTLPILVWFALMTPRLISLAQTGDTYLGDARGEKALSSADLISFWLPNPNHPLWGAAVSDFYLRLQPEAQLWNVAIGLVGLMLAIVGAVLTWRRSWRWALLTLFTALMAMGTQLTVFGAETALPLPYALIADLPGVRSSHRPNHFVALTILFVALLAAFAVYELLRRRSTLQRPLALGLLLLIFAIDGWAGSLPLFSRPVPQPYLAMPPADGALLPVPLHINFSNSENLWYQTFHRWPIIGGFIGREPPYPLARYAPGIAPIRYGRYEADDIVSPGWPEADREVLAALDIRYVMFHRRSMGSTLAAITELVAAMGLKPAYSDELITIYPVPEPATIRPLAYLGAGWGQIEANEAQRWRWMGNRAELHLLNPHSTTVPITLDLDAESYRAARPLTMQLDGVPIGTITIERARATHSVRFLLPPGEHVLYFDAPAEAADGQESSQISIAFMGIMIRAD
jgi:hypothetical protein